MPTEASNTTIPCRHDTHSAKIFDKPPPPIEIAEAFTLRAVEVALINQQMIPSHIVDGWCEKFDNERRDRLVISAYYAGLISHKTACQFVPSIDEERA